MAQVIVRPGQGALAYSETADALFDPKGTMRFFVDFITDIEDQSFLTATGGSSPTYAYVADNGGAFYIQAAATVGSWGAIASQGDFVVLDGSRSVYFESRVKFDSLGNNGFVVGLSADAPATTEFTASTATIDQDVVSITVGRDPGTESLTGGVANKCLQLSMFGATTMTETLIPLDFTLAVDTYYRIGFSVIGWTVQVYVNGKKYGPATKMNSNATTAMGVYCATATLVATTKKMTIDYISLTATR